MNQEPVKPFEELASEWAPRARHLFRLLADQVSSRLKARLPFVLGSVFFLGAAVAWFSAAAWLALLGKGIQPSSASLILGGIFAFGAVLFYGVTHFRRRRPRGASVEVLDPEVREIQEARKGLVVLFKDLAIAAKHSVSPNEVLKPHAVKVAVASTALGFLVALNLNVRKERIK